MSPEKQLRALRAERVCELCSFNNYLMFLTLTFYFFREFVSCVQSIKILSYSEVQKMSLDGDLGNVPVPNPAYSGTDSGNPWRAQYDDNSAQSFNR